MGPVVRAQSRDASCRPRDRRARRARARAHRRRSADIDERASRAGPFHAAGCGRRRAMAGCARHAARVGHGAGGKLRVGRRVSAAGAVVRMVASTPIAMNLGETRVGAAHPSPLGPAAGERRQRGQQELKHSFAHAMPFGAEVRDDGAVRFRLWAPTAIRVELLLQASPRDDPETLPLSIGSDGFHELTTKRARAGNRYRYRVDGGITVPDPASRANPDDVHGASEVVDPHAFDWEDHWRGRPWHEAVIYELHVGAFTPEGTFRAAIDRLPHLAALGVTAIELMPIADFPGRRNWGYDGALLFAPDARYGTPDDLKALVQAAHHQGLMVFLDVVYNHFGPEGNYLNAYAPEFFSAKHRTLWGQAINFDGEASRTVRDFYVHNTLYWLEEY